MSARALEPHEVPQGWGVGSDASTLAPSEASRDGAGVCSPRPVTRGEEKSGEQAAKVDWLNATFPAPALSLEGFIALLARMFGRPVSGIEGRGMLGFEKSVQLRARHGAEDSAIGCIAHGGEGQGGRWLFQLTGVGCSFVTDWPGLADLLESLSQSGQGNESRLTRVDLAVDFFEGEYSVEDALTLVDCGGFAQDGKKAPKTQLAGDWLGIDDGRTLYVGKAKNGKSLRVYEKGRQLGDADSDWTRFEVQFGNRDRVLPWSILTERDTFFAGAYPALADLVEVAATKIKTARPDAQIELSHIAFHLRRCYGKAIHALGEYAGASPAELVEGMSISLMPRRLNPSCTAAGVEWADVLARMKAKLQ